MTSRTTPATQLLVMAKAPVAGQVKTRLCPPATPEQAADIAAAAIADTLDAGTAATSAGTFASRTVVRAGRLPVPRGWQVRRQRGGPLADRLAHAFADTARRDVASLLIGMDTPQITPDLLRDIVARLAGADAVLGPAADGGWWALVLRDPSMADLLRAVPTSTPETGTRTFAALRRAGLRVRLATELRDVDTADDAWAIASQVAAHSRFAVAVRAHLTTPVVPA
jgi:uncharacterized protein